MRPASVTVSTPATASAPVVVNYLQSPFNASISVIATGVVNYTVQHTFDDIYAATYNPATGNWFNNDNANLVGATQSQTGNYTSPIRASRIVLNSGTGSVTMTIIEGLNW